MAHPQPPSLALIRLSFCSMNENYSMKALFFILTLLIATQSVSTQSLHTSIEKETFLYAVKDAQELYFDKYRLASDDRLQPVVVFLFGGGFRRGERDNPGFLAYFHFLAENGFTVISIDYRLGMKAVMRSGESLNAAITLAVEDLYDATLFIVEHAGDLKVNPSLIVINGSSAGGITVLQSMYELNAGSAIAKKLPEAFNYAGAIAFSGAILTRSEMDWQSPVPPIMLFHGDQDDLVPYDHFEMSEYGLYGSSHIAAKLEGINAPYWFITFTNEAHNVTGLPRSRYRQEILKFLNDMVIKQEIRSVSTYVQLVK